MAQPRPVWVLTVVLHLERRGRVVVVYPVAVVQKPGRRHERKVNTPANPSQIGAIGQHRGPSRDGGRAYAQRDGLPASADSTKAGTHRILLTSLPTLLA